MRGLVVLCVFLAIVGLVAWDPLHSFKPETKLKNHTITKSIADSLHVNEWPTQKLTELYAQFDNELETGEVSRETRNKCLELLQEMMFKYEAAIGGYEGASGVVWPIKVCAEAEKEFWPRITNLESFGIPMWEPEVLMVNLYHRYGALVNQGHEAAYHMIAGSK